MRKLKTGIASGAKQLDVERKCAMSRFLGILLMFCMPLVLIIVACGGDTITDAVQGIQVTGSGSAFGKPDVAILNLGISVEKDSVREAREEAAGAMQNVIDSLKDNGVAEEDIKTQHFSIQPRYDYVEGRQILRGYQVTNLVSAKVRDMETVGEVIDDAADAGGDLVRVQSITFTIDDPKELQEEARVEAMKDAHAKAQTLAELGDVELGDPISISEGSGVSYPKYASFDEERSLGATPIEPGQLEITVTVAVIYEIE